MPEDPAIPPSTSSPRVMKGPLLAGPWSARSLAPSGGSVAAPPPAKKPLWSPPPPLPDSSAPSSGAGRDAAEGSVIRSSSSARSSLLSFLAALSCRLSHCRSSSTAPRRSRKAVTSRFRAVVNLFRRRASLRNQAHSSVSRCIRWSRSWRKRAASALSFQVCSSRCTLYMCPRYADRNSCSCLCRTRLTLELRVTTTSESCSWSSRTRPMDSGSATTRSPSSLIAVRRKAPAPSALPAAAPSAMVAACGTQSRPRENAPAPQRQAGKGLARTAPLGTKAHGLR
mmetsp:Transcript_7067/g.28596  ORF Transcript_7067/g.28596 Transcript_7067/m.28596 type:complete len:283 (-) Transcript_7067:40-888(-)